MLFPMIYVAIYVALIRIFFAPTTVWAVTIVVCVDADPGIGCLNAKMSFYPMIAHESLAPMSFFGSGLALTMSCLGRTRPHYDSIKQPARNPWPVAVYFSKFESL